MDLNRRYFWFASLVMAISGCGPSSTSSGPDTTVRESKANGSNGTQIVGDVQTASFRAGDAQEFLQAVFARYRGATSYHDRGRVKLTHVQDGKPITRTAPMRLWLNRGELDLAVYDVRIAVEEARVMAWIVDESTKNFDSQVFLGNTKTSRPQLGDVLTDSILAGRIGAGLAGPPPQVEWLFDPQPMKSLFDSPYEFRFLQDRTVQRRLCRCVEVSDGREAYRFWVDPRASLIREVDLPSITVPDPDTGQPLTLSLAIELIDASFDRPAERKPRDSFPKTPRYVAEFVPLPPKSPPKSWGKPPSDFDVSDSRRQFRITSQGHNRDVAVVLNFNGDAASMASLTMLDHWIKQSQNTFDRTIRALVLNGSRTPFPAGAHVPFADDARGDVAKALGLSGGAIAMIAGDGTLMWTEPMLGPGNIAAVASVATDIAGGVDVPKRLRDQWQEQVAQYRREVLKRAVR